MRACQWIAPSSPTQGRAVSANVVTPCLQATGTITRSWRSMGASSKFFKSLIGGNKRGGGGGGGGGKAQSEKSISEKAPSDKAPSERSHHSEKDDIKKPAQEKSHEKAHKRWSLWKTGQDNERVADRDSITNYSQEFKMDQRQQMFDDVPNEMPSATSHALVVAEWAALRIQTAFRGFLARRALRALKGLIRLQALVRGHTVRRQAAITLRCMQALVRVQARVRARRVRMSQQGLAVQRTISQRRLIEAQLRESELGWCASSRTKQDLQAKLQQRHEGMRKRERARAYASTHQWRPEGASNSKVYFNHEGDKPHWGWSWLERWMAARPWENRTLDTTATANEETTELLDNQSVHSYIEDSPPRVQTKPTVIPKSIHTSPITSTLIQLQRQQQEMLCGYDQQSDASSPPCSTSNTMSNGDSVYPAGKRSYMAATKSARAKVRSQSTPKQRLSDDGLQTKKKRLSLPTREAHEAVKAAAGVSVSPNVSQGTARTPPSRAERPRPSAELLQHAYRAEKPSRKSDFMQTSNNSDRASRRNRDFMTTSYQGERPYRKAGELLTSAYKSDRLSRKTGEFMQQSYNIERPFRRNEDITNTSYNYERPRQSTDVRQASYEASRKKDDFVAHYNAERSSRKNAEFLQQPFTYERRPRKIPELNRYHPERHPERQSRKIGEFNRNDRHSSRAGDYLQRSYQTDRPQFRSGDYTSLTSSYGDSRKPFR